MTKIELPVCPGCRRRHKSRAKVLACIHKRLNPTLTNILLAPVGATRLGYKVSELLRRLRRVVAAYPDDGTVLP